MRKLVSVQKIMAVAPIPGADNIEVATVLGWQCVVKKSDAFQPGQLVCYAEVDSLFPREPQYEFLKSSNYRLKTARLRGQISQGLVLPLSVLPGSTEVQEGDDVTERLGVVKYEAPIPVELQGEVSGAFPGYIHKTDEPRIQSFPGILDELRGVHCYISLKIDGTSSTFAHRDGEFTVAGHNWPYRESETNTYWRMYRKYNLEQVLRSAGNYALQAEIAGPAIQKNRYGLKEHSIFCFNVFDINRGRHLDFADYVAFCQAHGIPMAPVVDSCFVLDHTVAQLLEMVEAQRYPTGGPAEGWVIRPLVEQYSKTLGSRASFKVLNNRYLLKNTD